MLQGYRISRRIDPLAMPPHRLLSGTAGVVGTDDARTSSPNREDKGSSNERSKSASVGYDAIANPCCPTPICGIRAAACCTANCSVVVRRARKLPYSPLTGMALHDGARAASKWRRGATADNIARRPMDGQTTYTTQAECRKCRSVT